MAQTNTTVIIIAIVLLIVIAVALYFIFKPAKTISPTKTVTTTQSGGFLSNIINSIFSSATYNSTQDNSGPALDIPLQDTTTMPTIQTSDTTLV